MEYLQASWGFLVMIGGLLLALVVLMLLDLPAQRRDAEQRDAERRATAALPVTGRPEGAPAPNVSPHPRASGPIAG